VYPDQEIVRAALEPIVGRNICRASSGRIRRLLEEIDNVGSVLECGGPGVRRPWSAAALECGGAPYSNFERRCRVDLH
jgi:hypothetical protein